jgi:serine/threonine-protein kinase
VFKSVTSTRKRLRSTAFVYGAAACAIALIGAFAVVSRSAKPELPAAPVAVPQAIAAPREAVNSAHSPAAAIGGESQSLPKTETPTAPRPARQGLAPAPARGVLAFAVAPWGEVYVNGTAQGTTPPLTQLMLPAGRHTIELRNGQRQPYIAQVEISPDRPQRISHRFQ